MMVDVPRRLPRTQGQRVQNVDRTHASASLGGSTAASRPVANVTPNATIYQAPAGAVVLGTAAANATSIASTGSGAGPSHAPGSLSIAIGSGSGPTADLAVCLGSTAYAYATAGVAVGYDAKALGGVGTTSVGPYSTASKDNATAVGYGAQSSGVSSTGVGYQATAAADNSLALGHYAHANAAGSVAIGTDSAGIWAIADNADDFVLGTNQHHIIVSGKLVLKDESGNLRRLVVDGTTGAVSTVAYP